MNPNFLPSGHLLHHRYSIQSSIGQGGFGITYLAYDQKLDQEVCIKELFVSGNSTRGANYTIQSQSKGGFSFEEFVQRFVQEARQLARFQHPNIVRVIDIFQENGTAYTVMEYVKGETLKSKVSREGALGEKEAMSLIIQLLDAVEEVHSKGMLHRDIKPDNVLMTPEGRVVLIDFGSAREFAEGKTTTQTAMLTPGYAPIEQYSTRGHRGPYTDIYALGATMYFLLTGEKPIPATDRVAEELIPPHKINSLVTSQLSSAVILAMELKSEHRFQSVAEIREAIKILESRQKKYDKDENESKILEKPSNVEKKENDWGIWAAVVSILVFGLAYLGIYGLDNAKLKEAVAPDSLASVFKVDSFYDNPDVDSIFLNENDNYESQSEFNPSQEIEEKSGKLQEGLKSDRNIKNDDNKPMLEFDKIEVKENLENQKVEPEVEKTEKSKDSPTNLYIQRLEEKMVFVKGGTFTMGCTSEQENECFQLEKPAHLVSLSSFYISKYEVTQALWLEVMGVNPRSFKGCDKCPVESISWLEVEEFIRNFNKITGKKYRLPTEAEWEYAARGGAGSRSHKYSGGDNLGEVGWYDVNSLNKTHPVGQKMANELGLYDMSGNVLEWCSDNYGGYSYVSQTNPEGPYSGWKKVVRGGSWFDNPEYARISFRNFSSHGSRSNTLGFRLAMSL